MGNWNRALDQAGIQEPGLREDYGRQREAARAFKREIVLAAGLLLPGRLVPHVLAAIAFMHHTDVLIDSGPLAERRRAYDGWEKEVSAALTSGKTDNPQLRPLINSVATQPHLGARVREFLASADLDLSFSGFDAEVDYQDYVDGYSLPAFMLIANLLGPDGAQDDYRAACRRYIEVIQRLDFINDLAEDLVEGRLTIPRQTMKEHGVTRSDLEQARDLPASWELITGLLDRTERGLRECWALLELVPPAHRPMLRCMIRLDELTIAACRRDVPALLRRSASVSKPAASRVLLSEYLQARRFRRSRRASLRRT